MTDTDRMVLWLRAAMDAAEKAAHATPVDPIASVARKFEIDSLRLKAELDQGKSDRIPYDRGQRDALHWASVVLPERMQPLTLHDPAAVLRRIAADRKTLDDCMKAVEVAQRYKEDDPSSWSPWSRLAYRTIRNLAEAWGWKDGQQ